MSIFSPASVGFGVWVLEVDSTVALFVAGS
jgi:hypothetical protein